MVVFRMEFDKTRWFFLGNSDQNCTQNSAGGGRVKEVGGKWVGVSRGGGV